MAKQQITTELSLTRETKNTAVFSEDEDARQVLRTQYIQRDAWEELGRPETIAVTVKVKGRKADSE